MTEKTVNLLSRRRFIQIISGSAIGGLATAEMALADGHAKVNPEDAQPKALGYVEDATTVDAEKYPKYAQGDMCSKCVLYSGADGKDYGPCGVFPGKEVSASGWCNTFAPKG